MLQASLEKAGLDSVLLKPMAQEPALERERLEREEKAFEARLQSLTDAVHVRQSNINEAMRSLSQIESLLSAATVSLDIQSASQ